MIQIIAPSVLVTAALWYLLWRFLPEPSGITPLSTALGCSAVAALLTLVAGVEAIAHERLVSPAIDPLSGYTNRRMQVNLRYLSNTLEQFIVFAIGLMAISNYVGPRLLIVLTIVWVLTRWAFWIGYHRSALLRGVGAPGMIQSMLVLLYAVFRYGSDLYGQAAGLAILVIFGLIEALLFWAVSRPSQ